MKSLIMCFLFAAFSLLLNSTAPMSKHVVKKGETLYSISKQYGLKTNDLVKANSLSAKNGIKIGQSLIIPLNNFKQTQTTSNSFKPSPVASTPDTPYREEDIRPRALLPEKVKPVVAEEKVIAPAPVVVIDGLRTSSSNATEYPEIFNQYSTHGYKIKKNKGAANYIDGTTPGNQNLAFYNNAETGSVIRVTNLMNQKTIFVKVMGKVPATDAGNEIVVKLSNKAAKDLGVADEKFLVEVASYSSN